MDRIAIVAGSDRGMGRETALALAEKHYTVIMACINIPNANRTGDEIKKAVVIITYLYIRLIYLLQRQLHNSFNHFCRTLIM
ncbi:hypothetical protein AGMMS49944_18810 [Spirochaetia bacterium]|nr:hypothetical protein AGMMS49944_18810 [Spirochaetia bacterium]